MWLYKAHASQPTPPFAHPAALAPFLFSTKTLRLPPDRRAIESRRRLRLVKFELDEINSGQDENSLWVALGFSSSFQKLDSLFIVCPATITPKDIQTDTYGL